MSLINNMSIDLNGGVCLVEYLDYYTYSNETIVHVTGLTNTGEYVKLYVNSNNNYSPNIYDASHVLIIDEIENWFNNYINSLVTTGYSGYNGELRENRVLFSVNNQSYYKLEHIDNYSGCTLNTNEIWAIVNEADENIWNGDGDDYFYYELDECDNKTGREIIKTKNINNKSETKFEIKYILKYVEPIVYPITEIVSVSGITNNEAIITFNLTSLGSQALLIENGICYGIFSNPTINDLVLYNTNSQISEYSFSIDNLIPNTTYFIKSYVKCDLGIIYSDNELTFKTL